MGDNHFGQLGLGLAVPSLNDATRYPASLPIFSQLVSGQYHTLAMSSDGRMFSFGGNLDGQLGTGAFDSHDTPFQITAIPEPMNEIAAGGAHSLAIGTSGKVYSFGRNSNGQLCRGSKGGSDPVVAPITGLPNGAISVCGGWAHSAIVLSDGSLWTSGLNSDGQLGTGDFTDRAIPTQVPGISSAVAVACGAKHTFVVTLAQGQYVVKAFGSNSHGQLCQPIQTRAISIPSPVTVAYFTYSGTYPTPSLGLYHSVYGVPAGVDIHAVGCGSNQYGQLGSVGVGTDVGTDLNSPVAIMAGENVANIVSGAYHTVILTTDNRVFVMGRNYDGQLGLGYNALAVTSPTLLSLSGSAVAIGGGGGVTAIVMKS